ncbi:MAG: DUF3987 domain-containing protein [Alphaproteobacteria bacterium]
MNKEIIAKSEMGFDSQKITHSTLGKPEVVHDYTDKDGEILFQICRWGIGEGKKILPFSNGKWQGYEKIKPLYNLPKIANNPAKPILIVEGEKTVNKAKTLFPDYVITTSSGGSNSYAKTDWSILKDRDVVIWRDNDEAGEIYQNNIADILIDYAKSLKNVEIPDDTFPVKWDVADLVPDGVDIYQMLKDAKNTVFEYEETIPFINETPPENPFPLNALSDEIREVIEAIHKIVKAPIGICANSVISVINLAVQGHRDILTLDGEYKPISCYFVSIAESGDRKSSADNKVMKGFKKYQNNLRTAFLTKMKEYEENLQDYKKLKGDKKNKAIEPKKPVQEMLICKDITIEGFYKFLERSKKSVGLFSSEGGQLVGGHALSNENKTKTGAGLCLVWDGEGLRRTRATNNEISELHGIRVSSHLMMQPMVGEKLLENEELKDQGLISRILISFPKSLAGTRFIIMEDEFTEEIEIIESFNSKIFEICETSLNYNADRPNELAPEKMGLEEEALIKIIEFYNKLETTISPKGENSKIKDFIGKSPEHALRLSATLRLYESLYVSDLTERDVKKGIALVEYYIAERKRMSEIVISSQFSTDCEEVKDWIQKQGGNLITQNMVRQGGPNRFRSKPEKLNKIFLKLCEHNFLYPIEENRFIDGTNRKTVYRIINR